MRYTFSKIDKTNWHSWHMWFAWFPVKARNEKLNCDELVWLEYVLRKKEDQMHPIGAGDYTITKYRTMSN